MSFSIEFADETQEYQARIKVIGCGGSGGNAVNAMMSFGLEGVEFVAVNTDAQALNANSAPLKIGIGAAVTKGLGAGADPEKGRKAALEDVTRIKEAIAGADMVFITAGMGGGTGTGAAPIIAQLAKEEGALTVGVVTKPFLFEGRQRARKAEHGIALLTEHVDTLITIPNEKLLALEGEDLSFIEAFRKADEVLYQAVKGISDLITQSGIVNVDFADVKTVMSETGLAMMGSAKAAGTDRARMAAEQAVACPLLEDIDIADARGVLVNISASKSLFQLQEMYDVMDVIKAFASESATVIAGTVYDDNLGDELRVTIVATGLGKTTTRLQPKPLTMVMQATGTDGAPSSGNVNYEELEQPAVMRRNRNQTVEAMRQSGIEMLDIPAFLRKQAD